MKKSVNRLNIFLVSLIAVLAAPSLRALPTSSYATSSVLAEGKWVKIAVSATGLHGIPAATLREWGFDDPSRVRVYGYGGKRIADRLDADTYIDDLPLVQSTVAGGTLVFYATGPTALTPPDKNGFIHHKTNPWTLAGYYFLTDSGDTPQRTIPEERGDTPPTTQAATTFEDYVFHETDLVSPGETGHYLVGEDMRYNPSLTVKLDMPGRVDNTPVGIQTRYFSFITSGSPTLTVSANNTVVAKSKRLPKSSSTAYGDTTLVEATADAVKGTSVNVQLQLNSTGVTRMANLDNIGVTYTRALDISPRGFLNFRSSSPTLRVDNASGVTIWDVTDPLEISSITHNAGTFTTPYGGFRHYAAFREGADLPHPEFVGRVSNQDLHSQPVPDMVIVTSPAMKAQAERIADIHRNSVDKMRVHVVLKDQVWNEFGSGLPDINAVRRLLKMHYDRGTDAEGHRLAYVLMMGRPFHDHRHLTEYMRTDGFDNMPIWQSDTGLNESTSYCSDDILAMLEDGSGTVVGNDRLCIATGRIAARDASDAKTYADKLTAYLTRMPEGEWKNKIVILADDQDNGVHLDQAERLLGEITAGGTDGNDVMFNKIYCDAYEKINGVTEGARDQMFKWLNEGAMWWLYIGHASIDTWTTEGMLTRTDLVNNTFFRRPPILYAATCTFQRWDGTTVSGSELLVSNKSGGVIASICPTRPVYISSNGELSRYFGSNIMKRDDRGLYLTVGEIMRQTKNMSINDNNRLRFVLNGDPALRVPMPTHRVVLDKIDGVAPDPENPPTIMARQRPVLEGYVTDWEGNQLNDFNGTLHLTIYDAEESVTTLGRGDDTDPGKESVFERQGKKLYAGRDKIVNGRFSTTVAMPSEIAWNYRNAAVSMYAVADTREDPAAAYLDEAMGVNRDFFVYGYDESAEPDTNLPTIEALYLNHESFSNGDVVNESPMMFAKVSDDVGINLSQAGVGHTLLMRIDDTEGFTDVSDYYTPASDGSPSGTVAYPVANLTAGNHSLTFRVWDTSNNFAQQSIDFYVQPGLTPTILDVYTDTNPAYTQANFYVRHNRPDATVTVTVEVFDLLGRPVWSTVQTGRSDMFVSSPVTWDLTDSAGRRVNRGIYLYRASVSTDGEQTATAAKRLAVAAE